MQVISHKIQLKALKNNFRILVLWLILYISPFTFNSYLSAQDLKFNESYEAIKASDYNLNSTWKEWPNFVICPSTYLSNKKSDGFTQEVIDSIQSAMDDADIIVCQNFKKDVEKVIS